MLQIDSALAESKVPERVVTRSTFQLAMFWLKAVAPVSMLLMVVARAVFHEPMLALKEVAV